MVQLQLKSTSAIGLANVWALLTALALALGAYGLKVPIHHNIPHATHLQYAKVTRGMAGGCPFMKATGLDHHATMLEDVPQGSKTNSADTDPTDPLSVANDAFHSVYSASHETLANTSSRLYVTGSSFILYASTGTTQTVKFTSHEYTDKKMVCHLPLAAFVRLVPFADGQPFPPEVLTTLNTLYNDVVATATAVANTTRFPNTVARQQQIQSTTASFLQNTITAGSITRAVLDNFVNSILSNVLLNVNDAAVAMVKVLDQEVVKMFGSRTIPPDVHVVVRTSHQATRQSMVLQYFACVMNTTMYQGDRLIYLQSPSQGVGEAPFTDLLGTVLLDSEISKTWFPGQGFRMQRDLLSDDARAYILKNFPCLIENATHFIGYENDRK